MNAHLNAVYQGILEGEMQAVEQAVKAALAEGVPPDQVLDEGMIAAMAEVGRLFETGEFFVPEMMLSARAMQSGLAVLKPLLVESRHEPIGKVLIGTVKGDMHDIGKNLVSMMLEGAGCEVVDLGVDLAPEAVVSAVQQHRPHILALSALLTTTMVNMEVTIQALEQAGLRRQVKVIVGGAPITERYATQIGADGTAPDASRAVGLVKHLIKANPSK